MSEFAEKIKKLRNEKKITQKQIACNLGITERNYQHYEAGSKKPSFDGLIKLADFFNVPADYLLGRTDSCDENNVKGEGN